MGQITSGVGLVSGINTRDLIDQLLAIEERPKQLVQQRNAVLTSQQVAFNDINAKLLVLKLSAGTFDTDNIFGTNSATSSDDSVLTASSSTRAVPGSYDFLVDQLVSTQQMITQGFVDQDTTPIAPAGGTLTFEFGDALLADDTELAQLNGGSGVRRGKIQITDRSGASATVDLSRALTVNDVLEAINNTSGLAVTASVEGDGLQLIDTSGGGGTLSVTDTLSTGTTADLGLDAPAVGNTLTGTQINALGQNTTLNQLNDANGVRLASGVDDFQIARRDGTTFNVNLDNVTDLGGVIDTINAASGGNVTASIAPSGTGLQLVDTSVDLGSTFQVTALNSSNAATDLGILATAPADTITGGRVLSGFNTRLIGNLNGGAGITTLGTIDITNRSGGGPTSVDLSSAVTVTDVIDLINAAGAGVTASVNSAGTGILLTDTTGSAASDLIVADNTGTAAADLGLTGSVAADSIDSGNLQLQYISEATRLDALNGGEGITRGRFTVTDSDGLSATVDLTQGDEITIQNVIDEINSRGLAVNARVNDKGDGLLIEDTGSGVTKLKVEEAGSTTARDLGILGEAANPGDDLDGSYEKSISIASIQTLTGTTALSTLNGGDGVDIRAGLDDLRITTQDGSTFDINLDGHNTIDDVINTINTDTGGAVTAAINTTSTGLILTDSTSGSTTFEVESLNNSQAAADLGILATDDNADATINGSTIIESNTLDDLVDLINNADIPVTATVINDGSTGKPFRLNLQSEVAGQAGRFIFDDGGLEFGASTLVEAQDAVVFFGSSDPANAIAVTSSTNTLTGMIPNATIDLRSTSDSAVRVTITRDDSTIVDAAKKFVDDFNTLFSTINDLDSYNAETEERGLLLGDPTLARIRSSLFRLVNSNNTDISSQFTTLAQVGITVGSGSRLRFDESKFRGAIESDFEAVQQLFTFKETQTDEDTGEVTLTAGAIIPRIADLLETFTDSLNGLLRTRLAGIDNQIQLNNDRIDQFDAQLARKRSRMEFQFLAMERALAQLQSQSQALTSLQLAALQFGSNTAPTVSS